MHFFERKVSILIQISQYVVPKGPIDNMFSSASGNSLSPSNQLLPETVLTKIQATMS